MGKPKTKRDLTGAKLCGALDIGARTLADWRARGIPHDKRGGKCFYNLGEVAAWMKQNNLTGKVEKQPMTARREEWEMRKIAALAKRYELQLARERGELIPFDDAKRTYGAFIRVLCNRVQMIGSNVAARWPVREAAQLQALIDEEANTALRDVTETPPPPQDET